MSRRIKGSALPPDVQRQCLAQFVHRFTRENIPEWAKANHELGSTSCRVQFASDQDWLDNTYFWVTDAGNLDKRYYYCDSRPTWPDGKPWYG